MTIKICKKKFETRLYKFGIIFANAMCISLITMFVSGIVLLFNNNSSTQGLGTALMMIMIGGIFGLMFNGMYIIFGKTYFIRLIQNKYKIFAWNNDC